MKNCVMQEGEMLLRKVKCGGGWREAQGSIGSCELSHKSLSEKGTFEPTHDRRNGVSQVNLWGKTIKADQRANAKACGRSMLRVLSQEWINDFEKYIVNRVILYSFVCFYSVNWESLKGFRQRIDVIWLNY